MFKKVLAAIIVSVMLLVLAVPVLAAPEGKVGKFSPTLDAIKDPAYDQSFSFGMFDQEDMTKGEGFYSTFGDTATSMDAKIYYLWDDKYLYAFIEVIMNNVTDAGKDFVLDSDNPWESDCVELWFLWDDLDDSAERLKISTDPFHNKLWGDGPLFDDVAPNSSAATTFTDKGYNAEFQIAIPPAFLKEGVQIKATLQINDHSADGTIAVGRQIQGGDIDSIAILTLGAPITIAAPEPEPEPVPEPVVDDTASGGGEAADAEIVVAVPLPAPVPETTPKTGDQTIWLILGLFAAAGLGVSVYKLDRKKI